MRRLLAVSVLLVLLPGCIEGLLDKDADAKVGLICAFLSDNGRVAIQPWGEPVPGALEEAALDLAVVAGREVTILEPVPAPNLPRHDMEAYRAWGDGRAFRDGGVVLHVLWTDRLPEPGSTGAEVGVGAVVLSREAILQGASRLGASPVEVGEAVALHHLGHALGIVNRGVPVQNPSIEEREGTPGHATDPSHVMHGGWEDVQNMTWHGAQAYSQADLADWEAAREVCG